MGDEKFNEAYPNYGKFVQVESMMLSSRSNALKRQLSNA